MSLLSWERGLKFMASQSLISTVNVAPLVGAWIEIISDWEKDKSKPVAPLVGAWIEMARHQRKEAEVSSLLSWERGLKYNEYRDLGNGA